MFLPSDLIKSGYFNSLWHEYTFVIRDVCSPSNQLQDLDAIKNYLQQIGEISNEYTSIGMPEKGECVHPPITYIATVYNRSSSVEPMPAIPARWLTNHQISKSSDIFSH